MKSQRGVQLRKWATNILKGYIKKGFAMDDDRNWAVVDILRNCWKEFDIRAFEKVFYRQVLETYATRVDYNPTAAVSIQFFK